MSKGALTGFVSISLPLPTASEQIALSLQRAESLRIPKPGTHGLRRQHHPAVQQQQQHLHARLFRAHPLRRSVRQGTIEPGTSLAHFGLLEVVGVTRPHLLIACGNRVYVQREVFAQNDLLQATHKLHSRLP